MRRRWRLGVRVLGGLAALAVVQAGCRKAPSAAEGRLLFHENGCANCHGPDGHGDGLLGQTLKVHPRDLRDAAAFKGGTSEDAIAATIANGLGTSASQISGPGACGIRAAPPGRNSMNFIVTEPVPAVVENEFWLPSSR